MENEEKEPERPQLFSNKTYNVLKYITTIWLPAVGTLYFLLAQIWGFPSAEKINGSITAVITFMGLLLGIATKSYNTSTTKYDGHIILGQTDEDGTTSLNIKWDPNGVEHKSQVILQVHK